MTPSFREILEVLNHHQVEYIVVGGVAAVIHGAPATTFDLDTLVRLNQANAERLAGALSQLDARFREHQVIVFTDSFESGDALSWSFSSPTK